uniref:NADH-ubiquinone oxidoreductase chain 3 n=1 Tax=Thraustochytrium aureum TaxID=42467 RepID=Q9G4B3_9STRA|nr:NADH dehydrogenase subunit 3 [Thraustochytrium aureum]
MTFLFSEYAPIVIYIGISMILSFIIFFASYSIAIQNPYSEKLSAYECGFDPFDDARNEFDVKFYLVALLFLVFDLETSFLFPWALNISYLNSFGFWSIIDFFFELVIGFFYVWKIGALEW